MSFWNEISPWRYMLRLKFGAKVKKLTFHDWKLFSSLHPGASIDWPASWHVPVDALLFLMRLHGSIAWHKSIVSCRAPNCMIRRAQITCYLQIFTNSLEHLELQPWSSDSCSPGAMRVFGLHWMSLMSMNFFSWFKLLCLKISSACAQGTKFEVIDLFTTPSMYRGPRKCG